uniref:Uncharacterized protein n=1 Tax=Eutreptiella gymnastica TaxID=73025 RepID=A0A7S4G340_9EUGL
MQESRAPHPQLTRVGQHGTLAPFRRKCCGTFAGFRLHVSVHPKPITEQPRLSPNESRKHQNRRHNGLQTTEMPPPENARAPRKVLSMVVKAYSGACLDLIPPSPSGSSH